MAEKRGYWTGEVGVQAWGKVPSNPLSPGSWQDYYTWRGLSLDSPMAVLLTYPLTVYYVITHLVPQSCKEGGGRGRSEWSRRVGGGGRKGTGGRGEGDRILK